MLVQKSSLFFLVGALVVGLLVGAFFGPGAAMVAAQDEGQVVTVTGYVTQYVGDDEIMFTDGKSTVRVEVEGTPRSQLPLNTPLTITAKVENDDDGKLEAKIISVQAGQGTGPGGTAAPSDLPVATVAQITATPINNQRVVLQGQITQKVSDEEYLFTDGTGTIVLDFDDMKGGAIPMNQPVTVFGQVDVEDGRVEVDVVGIQPAS